MVEWRRDREGGRRREAENENDKRRDRRGANGWYGGGGEARGYSLFSRAARSGRRAQAVAPLLMLSSLNTLRNGSCKWLIELEHTGLLPKHHAYGTWLGKHSRGEEWGAS